MRCSRILCFRVYGDKEDLSGANKNRNYKRGSLGK